MKTTTPAPYAQLFSLKNRIALLTGAGGQLGRQMASALHQAGAQLVLTDLDLDACRATQKRLNRKGPRTLCLSMNTASRASVEETRDAVKKTFGRLDILINNAGVGVFTPFETRSEAEYDRVMDTNVRGVFLCSQIFSDLLKRRRGSTIINVGSVYGVVSADPKIYGKSGRNSSEVYAASKAAVIQMTRYLAVYLSPHGIRVNSISPGGMFAKQTPDFVRNYSLKTPLGRMGYDHEIRGSVVFLASEAASYITGHNLLVDGGFSVW